LYINDIRASMSEKKVAGAGSSIARKCAFVGHLREAQNTAAVIELFVFIAAATMPKFLRTRKEWREQLQRKPRDFPLLSGPAVEDFVAVAHGSSWPNLAVRPDDRRAASVGVQADPTVIAPAASSGARRVRDR